MRRVLLPAVLVVIILGAVVGAVVADQRSDHRSSASDQPTRAAATPVLSPRRLPALLVEPQADAALAGLLDDIVARSPDGSCLVVRRGGTEVYAHNGDRWVVPASTQKLLTSAAALETLGEDHHFTTEVRVTTPIGADGILVGDLWLIGGGDPALDTPTYLARFPNARPATDLEQLADDVVAAGLTEIQGGVVGDESRYDTARSVGSWTEGIAAANRAGPLSALMVNDGFESFPLDTPDNLSARPAEDPAVHGAAVFDDLLEARGVRITEGSGSGPVPATATTVATVDSPALAEVLLQMNTDSDNTTAELLLKELAVADDVLGSTTGGAAVVVDALTDIGLPTVVVADGSGLSRNNITTCATLTGVLDHYGPESPLATSLAVGGETGTLAGRFLDDAIRGRISAKSGSLDDVSALAGLARSHSDETLTFAFVVNGPLLDAAAIELLQEELAGALVSWPDGPDYAQAGPQSPSG
ncbi:MAG: D-alanyl-D-alanine carboxypeptidase [Acidimicrobiia bacterium]|nr:D-alanyl-D-alanine carboxypeptidase [Acidimicrobiia bacterium]MDH5236758.1 D-alanyl-D-alanine carboxypeptidase [Acidimicrobiia bacterium]